MNKFLEMSGVEVPLICGAMYPCSNPELVAAASEAGGLGIVQPLSLIYVHGYKLDEGLDKIRSLTQKPIGFNALIEKSSKLYEDRMRSWIDIALEKGVRFFITALGNPKWVIDRVRPSGGIVFHDVTERRWADKALNAGVDGLICVNSRAGGHAGAVDPQPLYDQLKDLGVPLICAGGIGNEADFARAIQMGYSGVQMGTRFIATEECNSHETYKRAIVDSKAKDIVRTERVTGVPLAVINTPYVQSVGLKVGPLSRFLFRFRKTRHWLRLLYNIRAVSSMKKSALKGLTTKDYWQAGKSVETIEAIEPVKAIVDRFRQAIA